MIRLIAMFLMFGCAVSSIIVKKTELRPYKDSSKVSKLDPSEVNLTIDSIRDLRASKDMGFAYTGVKYAKTPIRLEQPIEMLLDEYFTEKLELRNIEVLSDSAVKLSISIINFQVYELIEQFKPERAKCELQIEFSILHNAKSWIGNYATEYLSAGDITDGTERLAPTMASCLNNLTEKLINDPEFRHVLE